MTESAYVCPVTHAELGETAAGLTRGDGTVFPFLGQGGASSIPNFVEPQVLGGRAQASLDMYDDDDATDRYRNFLDWLFATFRTDETAFRRDMIGRLRLRPGARVLVTGCGLGEDLRLILEQIGDGALYALDIAPAMVVRAAGALPGDGGPGGARLHFSVSDAVHLPFRAGWFDAAFHFGGINLFDDIAGAIAEMNRVVRPGGRVVFGDEGIGPWLRDTEYGRVVVNNNALWAHEAPLDLLPQTCTDAAVSWVLGNCFWLIEFTKQDHGPEIDMDVPHKGPRGGTMRTRYFGRLDGVSPDTAALAWRAAADRGVSLHEWLDDAVRAAAAKPKNKEPRHD